ncbi:apocytochrome f [Thermosynechococcaceae cyanobacterium Okahandja]
MKHFLKSWTLAIALAASVLLWAPHAQAYPFYAQQGYDSPREATGRIVCANCHLAAKPISVEVPQAVTPDSVFEAVVKIPYDTSVQQVLGDGSKGGLNVGAVLMLPEGFTIAPPDRVPEELQAKTSGVFYQPYSDDKQNIVLVGPLPGEQYQEIVFPVLAPNPANNKSIHFGKYSVHAGGNRGRGQVYPTGEKSNNNVFTAPIAGTITSLTANEDGSTAVVITADTGETATEVVPAGPELIVAEGQVVAAGEALTTNPNVGGFGQKDTEIVLQDPNRIKWLLVFFAAITLSQILLVLKKKQVEKVQAAEMNF